MNSKGATPLYWECPLSGVKSVTIGEVKRDSHTDCTLPAAGVKTIAVGRYQEVSCSSCAAPSECEPNKIKKHYITSIYLLSNLYARLYSALLAGLKIEKRDERSSLPSWSSGTIWKTADWLPTPIQLLEYQI